MVERILEEKNASTAAAKEFGSLRLNAGSASGASNSGGSGGSGGNNNTASGSGDSGVGGSNNNSCSQSQSGECWISTFFLYRSFLSTLFRSPYFPLTGFCLLYSFHCMQSATCPTVQAVCIETLQLPSTAESTHKKRRRKEIEYERWRESEKRGHIFKCTLRFPSSSLYLVLRLCVSTALPSLSSAFLLCLAAPIAVYWAQCFFRKGSRIIYLRCNCTLVPLCVWHFSFTFPSQFGQQCLATSKHRVEILHLKNSYMCPTEGAPYPSLGQVFVCILYVTRKGKSCRDTSVLDSRNINSHLFAFTI